MAVTNDQSSKSLTSENVKKAWQKLEITVLDAPSNTHGGSFKLDPSEDFATYRLS